MGLAGEDDLWEDEGVVLAVPPPGEKGFFLSHAGGESMLQQIFVDSLSKQYAFPPLLTDESE